MDTSIIGMLATAAGTTIAVVALVSRTIGNLQRHMDERLDSLRSHMDTRLDANQLAHDAIGLRIDGVSTELGGRIDGVSTELGGRIVPASAGLAVSSVGGRATPPCIRVAQQFAARALALDLAGVAHPRSGDDIMPTRLAGGASPQQRMKP